MYVFSNTDKSWVSKVKSKISRFFSQKKDVNKKLDIDNEIPDF